jgi:hypothetical protein
MPLTPDQFLKSVDERQPPAGLAETLVSLVIEMLAA